MAADPGADFLRLSADLGRLAAGMQPAARAVVAKACADTTRLARERCPVDTGNLRASIGSTTATLGYAIVGEVSPTASYAHFVEYGTSRHAPQPFMGPAFTQVAPLFEAAIAALAARMGP